MTQGCKNIQVFIDGNDRTASILRLQTMNRDDLLFNNFIASGKSNSFDELMSNIVSQAREVNVGFFLREVFLESKQKGGKEWHR